MNPEDEYEANYEYFPDLIGAYPSAFSIPAIFFVSQFINAIWYSAVSFATAFLNITSKSNHGIPLLSKHISLTESLFVPDQYYAAESGILLRVHDDRRFAQLLRKLLFLFPEKP